MPDTDDLDHHNPEDGSRRHLDLLLSEGEVGVWELDISTGRASRNLRHDLIFGYPDKQEEWSFEQFLGHVLEEDRDSVRARFEAAVKEARRWSFEVQIRRLDGSVGWISASGQPLLDDAGRTRKLIGHVVDITHIKRDEERLKLLAGELNHRVNNTLALVRSMITLSARNVSSVPELVEVLQTRIAALARTNRLLTGSGDDRSRIAELIEAELRPFEEVRTRVDLRCDNGLTVSAKQAEALSLALHELVTNAIKHGALSVRGGRVAITAEGAPEGATRIRWAESGGPRVAPPRARTGFGSQLLPRVLEAHGHLEISYPPEGVRAEIELGSAARRIHGAAKPAVAPQAAPTRPRILVVEDEALVAYDLSDLLSAAGMEVAGPVGSLEAAMALVSDDLAGALIDLNLSDGTSEPLAEALKLRGIPFALLSGRADDAALPEALRGVETMSKPYRSDQVVALARRLAGQSVAAAGT